MDCEYNIDGLTFSKEEFLNYIKKQPLNEVAEVLGIEPVPKAPFITDTAKYLKLGWKMMLREAVAQGATKIAWTTGEQQAERFNLSSKVKTMSLIKSRTDSGYNLVLEDSKGEEITGYTGSGASVTPSELSDLVGVELAAKLVKGADANKDKVWGKEKINPQFYTLSGLDLKVGGEGMKAFYGEPEKGNIGIVGQVAKALFKQEPKTVVIETAKNNEYTIGEANYVDGIGVYDGNGDMVAEFDTKEEANNFIAYKSKQVQHSVDITPELIRMVDGGISLFSKMSDDRESITSIPIPAGFTIIPQEEDWVSIADQNGYEGYMMSKDEALKQIKDKFPVGTPEMSDPTVTDLFRFFYDLSLKQIGSILQWNDPNGEYADWINSETYDAQRNNLTNDYAQAREILRSRINDWFNEGADVELTGLYVPADGNGDSTNLFDVNEDQYDRVIQELIDSGEIETIDPETKEPCNSYSYQ